MKTTILLAALVALLAVPATQAAESPTPKNAAQWCKAWKHGDQLSTLNQLFGAGSYADLFKAKHGKSTHNTFGKCVSATAKKLSAAKQAAAKDDDEKSDDGASAKLEADCAADQKLATPKYKNFGQCVSDAKKKAADED